MENIYIYIYTLSQSIKRQCQIPSEFKQSGLSIQFNIVKYWKRDMEQKILSSECSHCAVFVKSWFWLQRASISGLIFLRSKSNPIRNSHPVNDYFVSIKEYDFSDYWNDSLNQICEITLGTFNCYLYCNAADHWTRTLHTGDIEDNHKTVK